MKEEKWAMEEIEDAARNQPHDGITVRYAAQKTGKRQTEVVKYAIEQGLMVKTTYKDTVSGCRVPYARMGDYVIFSVVPESTTPELRT